MRRNETSWFNLERFYNSIRNTQEQGRAEKAGKDEIRLHQKWTNEKNQDIRQDQ
jgi:hypothetical protein